MLNRQIVIVAVVGMFSSAQAAIINVPGDQPTIQVGIFVANPGDEVVVAMGTYNENINFLGQAITVRSTDPNDPVVVLNTIINGGGVGRVVSYLSGEGSGTILEGFTITNGFHASNGGGMVAVGGGPTVTNCTFIGNTAGFRGGGMYFNDSNPTVTNCTFSANTSGFGGGMYFNNSNLTVTNCTFAGNTAFAGGGMWINNSNPTVTNCTFSGNSAGDGGGHGDGGGMYISTGSSPTVTGCTFESNSADGLGGGMYGGQPTVSDCTFDGNSAGSFGYGYGGGMYFSSGSPTLTNCTFIGNSAINNGGGMYIFSGGPTVTNCILWNNSPDQISGSGSPAVAYSDVQGGWPGIGDIDADPLFVDPANGDFRLSLGSPCIDAADNTAVPIGVFTDLDGNSRFRDDPATPDTGVGQCANVDMGAYEFQSGADNCCVWDLDHDDIMGVTDLLALLGAWGTDPGRPPDFDNDGDVGVTDLLKLLAQWGPCN